MHMVCSELLIGLRVLVLDDQYYIADDTRSALEAAGAMVLGPFSAVVQVLNQIKVGRPDCAVLDINLGNGPNFQAAEVLADLDVPFVFLTGYDATAIPVAFSARPHLQKPLQKQAIIDVVAKLCGR